MAVIQSNTAFRETWPRQLILYRLVSVATGDQLDLSGEFGRIIGAAFISMTGGQIFAAATVSGTTVTITNSNLNDAAGFLIVVGAQPT